MAHVHAIGRPENDSERTAIRRLADELPDGYQIVHNFELTTGRGLPYEYDVVVVADFAVFHVEVKGYRGAIRGNARQWAFENDYVVPSPIPLANKKSKILASRLHRRRELRDIWVETCVLLSDERARIDLSDDQAGRVVRIDEAADALTDPSRLPVAATRMGERQVRVFRALFGDHGRDVAPCEHIKRIGLYDVIEKINQTDARTVFLARHRYIRTRPRTILKVFHFDAYTSDEARQRQIEAIFHDQDAMRLLGAHPNLIDTMDMFAWDHDSFVAPTEYVEHGRPLETLLAHQEDRQISWAAKADIVAKMAHGLRHAHRKGVIHRDIRPLNVVVAPDGIVKLVNFDLARIEGSPHPRDARGLRKRLDLRYTAPEVHDDPAAATPASDIYSLGVLFYELITSETPYRSIEDVDGATPLDLDLLRSELSTPGSEDFMAAPEDAVAVIRRMTRQEPGARYQDVDEIIEDLTILRDE